MNTSSVYANHFQHEQVTITTDTSTDVQLHTHFTAALEMPAFKFEYE